MKILFYNTICPFSKQIKFILQEKNIGYITQQLDFWKKTPEVLRLNPTGELPVLLDQNQYISGVYPIIEYLHELEQGFEKNFLGLSAIERAEARRISYWFNEKFFREVSKPIINEKIIKYYNRIPEVNSNILRITKENLLYHLEYIAYLLRSRDWLAGNTFSIADIAASVQLSVLDYLGDIPWDYNQNIKNWYMVLKSKPSFRTLLVDKIQGFNPPKYYQEVDF